MFIIVHEDTNSRCNAIFFGVTAPKMSKNTGTNNQDFGNRTWINNNHSGLRECTICENLYKFGPKSSLRLWATVLATAERGQNKQESSTKTPKVHPRTALTEFRSKWTHASCLLLTGRIFSFLQFIGKFYRVFNWFSSICFFILIR